MREGNFLWQNNGDLTFTDVVARDRHVRHRLGLGRAVLRLRQRRLARPLRDERLGVGGQGELRSRHLRDDRQTEHRSRRRRNWPPMGNKSLSGYQKKRLFHNERGQVVHRPGARRHGLDSTRDGRGIARGGLRQRRPARPVRRQRQRRALPLSQPMPRPPQLDRVRRSKATKPNTRRRRRAVCVITAGGRTQLRFVNGGNGFAAQGTHRVHAGLAPRSVIDRIEIRWPDGRAPDSEGPPSDRIIVIREGRSRSIHCRSGESHEKRHSCALPLTMAAFAGRPGDAAESEHVRSVELERSSKRTPTI